MNGGAPAGATPGPLIQKADVEYNLRDTASGVSAVGKGALDVATAFVPVLIELGVVVTIASRLQLDDRTNENRDRGLYKPKFQGHTGRAQNMHAQSLYL